MHPPQPIIVDCERGDGDREAADENVAARRAVLGRGGLRGGGDIGLREVRWFRRGTVAGGRLRVVAVHLGYQAIAVTAHAFDVARVIGPVVERLPQQHHALREILRSHDAPRPPHPARELLVVHDVRRVLHEHAQQVEAELAQRNHVVPALHAALTDVQREISESIAPRRGRLRVVHVSHPRLATAIVH